MTRLAILTGESKPELSDDGQAIRSQFEQRNIQVEQVSWTDRSIDWETYSAVLVQLCWGYYTEPEQFRSLLAELSAADVAVYNPIAALRWNMHKSYLLDLAADGIRIPSTVGIDAGSNLSLEAALEQQGLTRAVIKPAIGAGSTGVWRTSLSEASSHNERFREAVRSQDVVVQEFVPEITAGERSAVFIRGNYSHAWNDTPEAGDFSAFEETDLSYEPTASIRNAAETVVETACNRIGCEPTDLPYARVDYVERDGTLVVLELELIEPYLGLTRTSGGVDRFVSAVADLI